MNWKDQKREKNGRFLSFDGSRTMRKVYSEKDFEEALQCARLESVKPDKIDAYSLKDIEMAYRAGLNDHSGILSPSKKVEYYLNRLTDCT